eukprot:101350_1
MAAVKDTKVKPMVSNSPSEANAPLGPTVPVNTYWQLKSNQITDDDEKEMEDILDDYCDGLCPDMDKTLVFLSALEKKHGVPLIQLVFGVYSRELIKWYANPNHHNKPFAVHQFNLNYPLFQHYENVDPKIHAAFDALISILIKRSFCEPLLNEISYVIQDDLNAFIEIQRAVHHIIRTCIKVLSLPVRLDLLILPRKVKAKGTINDIDQQVQIRDLNDVFDHEVQEERDEDAVDYYHCRIEVSEDVDWVKVLQAVIRAACDQFDIDNLQQSERYVLVIDRRAEYCTEYFDIYFYQVPEALEQTLPLQYYRHFSLLNFYFSKTFVLPTLGGRPIGLYARSFQMFALSYHLDAIDDINVNWYFNGSQVRFDPSDMITIWPMFFEHVPKGMVQMDVLCNERFESSIFDAFWQSTTQESNDIYVTPQKQYEQKPIMYATSNPDEESESSESSDVSVDTNTLCMCIKQKMGAKWLDLVSQVIQRIEKEFEEIEDIEDDIGDIDSSEILEGFNGDFQQQLKGVIEDHIATSS